MIGLYPVLCADCTHSMRDRLYRIRRGIASSVMYLSAFYTHWPVFLDSRITLVHPYFKNKKIVYYLLSFLIHNI